MRSKESLCHDYANNRSVKTRSRYCFLSAEEGERYYAFRFDRLAKGVQFQLHSLQRRKKEKKTKIRKIQRKFFEGFLNYGDGKKDEFEELDLGIALSTRRWSFLHNKLKSLLR
jgi:hypothetical protein